MHLILGFTEGERQILLRGLELLRVKIRKLTSCNCKKWRKMENKNDVAGNHLGNQVKVADLIWVETNGGSWWPAQVVSEDAVSGNNKPIKTSSGEVPVRLYGSYKFLYVDPQKCCSDFEIILEQNNGSHRDIFLKALDQARIRSFPRLKKHRKMVDEKANGKPTKQDGLLKNAKVNGSSVQAEVLTEAGARRLRVMRYLGLIAPSGSPYHKNGRVLGR